MSLLPASASSPKQVSESLAQDTDLYVGIIGWRYGSPVRESPGVSYTQLEFRAAAEAGVPRLVFLLSDDNRSNDANEPNLDRQIAFRHEITESGITVQMFGSPERLAELLFHSIWRPAGWDPAFMRVFLRAVDRSTAGGATLGRAVPGVTLAACRKNSTAEIDALEDADADRLVVLGGPGAGKSWLARQIARRAAQAGMERLDMRAPLAEIELPLLVPIAPFVDVVKHAPSVWDAVVIQAVKELEPFLPNHRSMARIRRLLEPRTDRYVLILEGLDEAPPLPARTERQIFDALIHDKCRLMVTSRPGRWRGLLDATPKENGPKYATIELQPLQPAQVMRLVREAALEGTHADKLTLFLSTHDALAEAARVPLIARLIAVAGSADTIHDVYDRAINYLLRGEWRAGESSDSLGPYQEARSLVEQWAWRSAAEQNDPVTGVADWRDAIAIGVPASDPVVRGAVDNVVPLVEQDRERLIEQRRFVHRAIRERLVAAHIARLPVDEAASALEPHLWFDDTWRPIVPAAVAAHAKPAALLRRVLVGELATGDGALAGFRARDGLGELGDMVERLHREASNRIWDGDPVLQPIVQGCLRERHVTLTKEGDAQDNTPIRERVAGWLRTGELPMRDTIAPQIHASAFTPAERAALAGAVHQRLVSARMLSKRGRLLSRDELAIALEALQPDVAVLASARSHLMEILRDVRRRHEADDVLDAVLILRPTDAEREAIAALASAAIKDVEDAWDLVGLAKSLLSLELTTQQRETLRDALVAGIDREKTSTWTRELLRAFSSTRPEPGQIAICILQVLASATYRAFDSHDRRTVYEGLQEIANASAAKGELLRGLIRRFLTGSLDSDRRNLVQEIAGQSRPEELRQAAQDIGEFIQTQRGVVYNGLKLFRLLKTVPPAFVVDRLLELLEEPDAPWATIGEEVATMDATDIQRSAVARRLLSVLVNEPEIEVKARAANALALLRPDDDHRLHALSTLRAHAHTWAGLHLEDVIAALAALGHGDAFDVADLRLIVEQLERHQSDGTSLGFGWANRLINVAHPDAEMRRQLVAVTLTPADRLPDVGFIAFSDRLIDAVTLAGDDKVAKKNVGDVCIDALHLGVNAFQNGEPLLESYDLETLLKRVSTLGLPPNQQTVAVRLAATVLPDLILRERSPSAATSVCRSWRALDPPEELIRELSDAILKRGAGDKGQSHLLQVVLELEPPADQRSEAADILIDQIVSDHTRIDVSMIERVAISVDHLRRLADAGSVPLALLKAAASNARHSISLADWKAVLPDLARGETARSAPA